MLEDGFDDMVLIWNHALHFVLNTNVDQLYDTQDVAQRDMCHLLYELMEY